MFIGNFIGPFDRNYFYAKLGDFVFFGHVYLTCWKMVKDSMNEMTFAQSKHFKRLSRNSLCLQGYVESSNLS